MLRGDPQNSSAMSLKAEAFRQLNRLDEQEAIYRELTHLRPNYWPAYNDLGKCLYDEAKYAEAAQCYETAAQIAPRVALPLTNLGVTYVAMGKNADAVMVLKRSLALSPSETAYSNLGDVAFEAKNYPAARDCYLEALKLTPRDSLIQADVGDCYEMLGDKAKVTESYTRAADLLGAPLKINPNDGPGWMTLAFYQAKIGQGAGAKADMALADQHGATSVDAQFTKARALMLLGRTNEAKALVLACLDKGLTPASVDLAVELGPVRTSPEYAAKVGTPAKV
jgi:tetratricopeptide (TPR) repeat protein